mmetsp:Transcript_204/g.456  ORF Transcript_204/g.456 Transcript_204/m.456 type:complete len:207 (+) Transcript_204:186-806(+)
MPTTRTSPASSNKPSFIAGLFHGALTTPLRTSRGAMVEESTISARNRLLSATATNSGADQPKPPPAPPRAATSIPGVLEDGWPTHQASRRDWKSMVHLLASPRIGPAARACEKPRSCGAAATKGVALVSVALTASPPLLARSNSKTWRACSAGRIIKSTPLAMCLPKRQCIVSSSRPWSGCPAMAMTMSPGLMSGCPGSSSTSSTR